MTDKDREIQEKINQMFDYLESSDMDSKDKDNITDWLYDLSELVLDTSM